MMQIRKIGRSVILPHERILRYIEIFHKKFAAKSTSPILDFGSGTLFFSEKLAEKYNNDIYAVDILYERKKPQVKTEKIKLFENLNKIPDDTDFSMIFTSDVLHHIDPEPRQEILDKLVQKTNLIVVKEIEAKDFLGNLQNKLHDLILNQEIIHDIYSKDLRIYFKEKGFKVRIFQMKKFGYPHFLLIAYK